MRLDATLGGTLSLLELGHCPRWTPQGSAWTCCLERGSRDESGSSAATAAALSERGAYEPSHSEHGSTTLVASTLCSRRSTIWVTVVPSACCQVTKNRPSPKSDAKGLHAPSWQFCPREIEFTPIERVRLITYFTEHSTIVYDQCLADEDGRWLLNLGGNCCLGRGCLLLPFTCLLTTNEE